MLAASISPAQADTDPRSLRLGAVARPAADLYPGGSGAAQFTVGNPNPFPVRLLSLSFGPVRSSAPAACPPGVLRVHRVRLTAVVVPAGATAVTEKAPRAFRLSRSAPNGCQGVTFTASATVVAEIVDDDDGSGGGASATAGGASGSAGPGAGWAAASVPGVLAHTGAPLLALTSGGFTLALAGGAALRFAARRRKNGAQAI
jgi:hypothetical protein